MNGKGEIPGELQLIRESARKNTDCEDSLVDKSVGFDVGDHVASRALAWAPLLRDDDSQLLRLVTKSG